VNRAKRGNKMDTRNKTKRALINGEIVKYDALLTDKYPEEPDWIKKNFVYLGKGIIYDIDGIKQKGETEVRFYKKR
jgi:hypothetical protein